MRVAVGLTLCFLLAGLSPLVSASSDAEEAWPGEPIDNHVHMTWAALTMEVNGWADNNPDVVQLVDVGDSTEVILEAPEELAKYIAVKGSVALNGTSLTVNKVDGKCFGINFIPHTKTVTTWGQMRLGDMVNIEIDTLARYVDRLHASA